MDIYGKSIEYGKYKIQVWKREKKSSERFIFSSKESVDYNYAKLIKNWKTLKSFFVHMQDPKAKQFERNLLTKIKHKYNILSSVEAQTDE